MKDNIKYFTISQVSEITGISLSKLRYIEKYNPLIRTTKIRDRRYYTRRIIDYIIEAYGEKKKEEYTVNLGSDIINKIDITLDKFRKLVNINAV